MKEKNQKNMRGGVLYTNKQRNTNIELLRIISIIMIVISHYTVFSGITNSTLPLGITRFLLEIMKLGNIGTILFVLITGYFLIKSNNKFKLSKILKLWLQISFYSISIYIITILLNIENFSINNLIKAFLPITFQEYWFATAYIVLYIFHPFINKLLNSLDRKEHLKLIFLSLFLFSVLYTLTTKDLYGNELIQLIIFYIIGAYFGKYEDNIFKKKKINILLLSLSAFILITSVIIFDIVGTKIPIISEHSTYFFNRASIILIIFSISLFNIFANKKNFSNKYINNISSCVFGVYLISENSHIRHIIWDDIFKVKDYVMSNFLIIHLIITLFIILIVCILIDWIRKQTLEKLYNKYIDNKINNIQNSLENRFEQILNKISL